MSATVLGIGAQLVFDLVLLAVERLQLFLLVGERQVHGAHAEGCQQAGCHAVDKPALPRRADLDLRFRCTARLTGRAARDRPPLGQPDRAGERGLMLLARRHGVGNRQGRDDLNGARQRSGAAVGAWPLPNT